MTKILITGGRVIDPAAGLDSTGDVRVEKGRIVADFSNGGNVEVIDAAGMLVVPGLIDMHVHLREPGREDEETIDSGARAAAHGGFTTIACMPNTAPAVDSRALVDFIRERAENAPIDVLAVGAVTVGLAGKRLSDMGEMAAGGAVGFSDDGRPVTDGALMRAALEYSRMFGLPIISHAEDLPLAAGGVMNEGPTATRLGLKGIPAAAEEAMVARDVILAETTGGRLHITHVSTAGSVALIRTAKSRGALVTADCTPHHLALTDERLETYDANFKMNPPLRSEADRQALIEGLLDGTIDAIASDHAPHAVQEKEAEIETAPFGTVGLETTVPALLSYLKPGKRMLAVIVAALTSGPARVLGLDRGSLAPGAPADVTVIDPKAKVEIERVFLVSKCANSAFLGEKLTGAVTFVLKNGKIIVREGELVQ